MPDDERSFWTAPLEGSAVRILTELWQPSKAKLPEDGLAAVNAVSAHYGGSGNGRAATDKGKAPVPEPPSIKGWYESVLSTAAPIVCATGTIDLSAIDWGLSS